MTRRLHPFARAAALVVLVSVTAALAAGCVDPTKDTVIFTTTTRDPSASTSADVNPTIPPVGIDDFERGLDDAVKAKDLCAFVDAVDLTRPDTSDPDVARDAYEALAAATHDAAAFVPAELRTAWSAIEASTDEAEATLRRVRGDVTNPAVRGVFDSSAFSAAFDQVTGWTDVHCR
jgi:hypothetical protein